MLTLFQMNNDQQQQQQQRQAEERRPIPRLAFFVEPALELHFPAGLVTDPNEDLNPETRQSVLR